MCTLIRNVIIIMSLVVVSHTAAGSTSAAVSADPGKPLILAKSEKDTGKAKAKSAPKKKAAKESAAPKTNKKPTAGKEKPKAKTKSAAREKDPAKATKTKAKTAPVKDGKKKAAAATAATAASATEDDFYNSDGGSGSTDAGFWFMLALGILAVCGIGFMLWLEYRPTVYPSGKSYGPFDYLPAAKGGAFTLEYGADPMAQWNSRQRPAASTQQPATVTREPLHATRKTEQVPRTRESA